MKYQPQLDKSAQKPKAGGKPYFGPSPALALARALHAAIEEDGNRRRGGFIYNLAMQARRQANEALGLRRRDCNG